MGFEVIPPAAIAPSGLKSVRPFSIAVNNAASGTATITAVNTAKSFIVWQGFTSSNNASNNFAQNFCSLVLTNSTTVTATFGQAVGAGTTVTTFGTVVEFN